MDTKKQSVDETWQKLKDMDVYDRRQEDSRRLHTHWNSYSKKDCAKSRKASCCSTVTTQSSPYEFEDIEAHPFILGTSRYQFTPGELQQTLGCATRALLQSQKGDLEKNLSNFQSTVETRGSNDMQSMGETRTLCPSMGKKNCSIEESDQIAKLSAGNNEGDIKQHSMELVEDFELCNVREKDVGAGFKHTTIKTDQDEINPPTNVDMANHHNDAQQPLPGNDEGLIKSINMDVNRLIDPKADVRYEALLRMHHALVGDIHTKVHPCPEGSNEHTAGESVVTSKGMFESTETFVVASKGMFESAEKFVECVKEIVTKSLLRRFADPSERCRLLSISFITALLQSSPPTMVSLMSYILTVIVERLPIKSLPTEEDPSAKVEVFLVETSEEVRLALIQLLHSLLTYARKKIKYYASEVATILTASAMDTYPEVLLETFATMTLLGELCKQKLKPVAKQLISVVLQSLSHNRQRVRVAAIKSIHRLVLCGAHESIYDLTAYRDPNLVPIRAFYQACPKTQYLALLASNKNVQVREELLRAIASWLCELWERKEHECRLVPYILTGFTDENPSTQDLAFQLMEQVGRQYEEENQKEVADVQVYLPEDIDYTDAAQKLLPRAFKTRPCLGARIMVRSCLTVMLHALRGDLEAWTSGTKALAADFLYTLLMFAEENITMHLQALIAIMQKAFKEPLVEKQIAKCAYVLGFFADPTAYLKIVVPLVSGELNTDMSVHQLGATLKMLASIMSGSPSSRIREHIPELCSLLTTPDLLTCIQLSVNEGIVSVAEEMARAWSDECNKELTSLVWLLLNASASSDFCGRPASKAESVMDSLAMMCGAASGGSLIAAHAETILDLLPHPTFWNLRSLDVLVFCRVLQVTKFINLNTHPRIFRLLVFFGRASWNTDLKHRLLLATHKMSIMTSSLKLPEEVKSSMQKHMENALPGLFEPCLEDPSLINPALVALSHILSNEVFAAITIPPSLISTLQDMLPSTTEDDGVCANVDHSTALNMVGKEGAQACHDAVKDGEKVGRDKSEAGAKLEEVCKAIRRLGAADDTSQELIKIVLDKLRKSVSQG